jgi:hypothetical protein
MGLKWSSKLQKTQENHYESIQHPTTHDEKIINNNI